MALRTAASRACVICASKYTEIESSERTVSRSVLHRSMPCRSAMARSFCADRPTSTGSGMMREPSGSSTPPSLRMARTDLVRCWRYPMRPVTPFMAIPSTRSPICRPTFLMKALSKVCQTRAERQCPGESCCAATGERSSPRPDCTVISHSPYRRGRRSATFLPVRRPLRPLPTVPGKPVSPPTRRFSRTSRRVVPRAYAAVS